MKRFFVLGLLCLSLCACQKDSLPTSNGWRTEQVNGRTRFPVYTMQVPTSWKTLESPGDNLTDTKKPLVTFIFTENNQTFTITVHNFPFQDIDDQIPPLAQVERWKKQFENLDTRESELKPVAFGGYSGQFFKGVGIFKGEKMEMLAWSLQLPPEHYRALSHPQTTVDKVVFEQMRADVSIKVIGPVDIVSKHRGDIDQFVNSFHMIQAIPAQ